MRKAYIPTEEDDMLWIECGEIMELLRQKSKHVLTILSNSYGAKHKIVSTATRLSRFSFITSTLTSTMKHIYEYPKISASSLLPKSMKRFKVGNEQIPLDKLCHTFPVTYSKRTYHTYRHPFQMGLFADDKEFIEDFIIQYRYLIIRVKRKYPNIICRYTQNALYNEIIIYLDHLEADINAAPIITE